MVDGYRVIIKSNTMRLLNLMIPFFFAAHSGNGLNTSNDNNVFKISGDLVRDIEIVTTTSPKTNRVNVLRVNKATLPFTVKDVRQGTIITTMQPTVRSANAAGLSQVPCNGKVGLNHLPIDLEMSLTSGPIDLEVSLTFGCTLSTSFL